MAEIQVLKIPPPYGLAEKDQMFNRWLLELTGILSKQGGIDADAINGAQASVAALTEQVAALTQTVVLLQRSFNLINARLSSQTTVPIAGQGQDEDWIAVTTGGGKGVYVKKSGAWVLIAS